MSLSPTQPARASAVEREIAEQPRAVAAALDRARPVVVDWLAHLPADLPLLFVARGSSDNASLFGRYALALRSGREAFLALPSVTTLYGRPPARRAAAVAISQSGRSPDIVEVMRAARSSPYPSLAVTNAPSSPLARAATHVVDLGVGEEVAVAATKSYTASVAVLALIAALDGGETGDESALASVPVAMADVVAAEVPRSAIEVLSRADRIVVTGRGVNLATAHEVALKIQELTGCLVEALSPADLAHGPIRAIGPDTPVVALAPSGGSAASIREAVGAVRSRGAPVVLITDEPALMDDVDAVIELPAGVPEWLSPLTCVIPGQKLGVQLASAHGLDVDAPTGLSKVTETF
jgi:glucosamine--fructose-6-phosphate aminotransferase (isomerizing)